MGRGPAEGPVGEGAQDVVDPLLSLQFGVRAAGAVRKLLSTRGVRTGGCEPAEGQRDGVRRRIQDALATSGVAESLADHLLGGSQVHFHQDRRRGEDLGDIVEPIADVVRRKLVGGVKVEADQVADRVVVLGRD